MGRPGRDTLRAVLPDLRRELALDLVVANGENAAGGFGITRKTAGQLLAGGVDVITSGNHIWDKPEIVQHMESGLPVLRPLNYPAAAPGHGHAFVGGALIVNLIGRLFVGNFDCPFAAVDSLLAELPDRPPVVIVDFHAEATAEKEAMGWHLDGRVSALAGTHTHVPTADARVLPGGSAYVTDLGMVGATNSIIGGEIEGFLERFLTQMPTKAKIPKSGPTQFNSVLFEIDESTGRALSVRRVDRVGQAGASSQA